MASNFNKEENSGKKPIKEEEEKEEPLEEPANESVSVYINQWY
jgi:hypothetical protein